MLHWLFDTWLFDKAMAFVEWITGCGVDYDGERLDVLRMKKIPTKPATTSNPDELKKSWVPKKRG